jgi:hypothetical protein
MSITITNETFSNGLPAYSRFKNGFYCSVCDKLTEHKEINGFRICTVCGLKKPYLLSIRNANDLKRAHALRSESAFRSSITKEEKTGLINLILPNLLTKSQRRYMKYRWPMFYRYINGEN